MLRNPFRIRILAAYQVLNLGVIDNSPRLQINEKHTARSQSAVLQNVSRIDIENARLRGQDDATVARHGVTRRTQTITIQDRAGDAPVGKGNRRRSVPWLHQTGVKLVKGASPLLHVFVLFPGFRNEHHHGLRQTVPAVNQQFEGVVQVLGIAAAGGQDRLEQRQLVVRSALYQVFPRTHPIHISAERIDLAVMADHSKRMSKRPRRQRVRAEARMNKGNCRFHKRTLEVKEVPVELLDGQHSLVDNSPCRKAANVQL